MGIQINGNTNNINAGIGSLSIEDLNELDIVGVATASNFKTGSSNLHSTGLTVGNNFLHTTGINVGTGATIHVPATNVLTFGTNSNERLRIASDGDILIGTQTSAGKLTVDSGTSNTCATFQSSDSGAGINLKDNSARSSIEQNGTTLKISADTGAEHANSDLRLQVDGSTKTLIDSNGDIFIGTTTDIAPSNGTNLCVSDATISRLILEKQSTIKYGLNVSSGFTIYDETNDAARFSITSGGDVNITGGNLHVGTDSATANFTDSNGGNTKHIEIGATGGGDALLTTHSSGYGVGYFGYEAGGDRLVIACDGGGGNNKIDFITDAGTSTGGGTDNLNGKVPKMRITSSGVLLQNETSAFGTDVGGQFRFDNSGGSARYIFRNRANNGSSRVRLIMSTLNRAANADQFSGMEKYQSGGMAIFNGESDTSHCNINFFTGNWEPLRLRNGNVNGQDSVHIKAYWGTSNGLQMEVGGPQSGTHKAIRFQTSHYGGERGYIGVTLGGTSYNSSSDYRMKQDVVDLTGAIDRVKSFKPRRFKWKEDPTYTVDGFLAHEASTVVPESVDGEKDAVDSNGDPEYQVMDNSKLVPVLTAALKEAIAKIETLETKVAALEGS